MALHNKIGAGDAAVTLARQNIQEAIERWQMASDAEKGDRAFKVLSHVGALPGMRLADFVEDEETAKQIKADFEAANK